MFYFYFLFRIFSGRFDTSGSMLPRLVPEILIIYALGDVVGGIGDSRSWISRQNMVHILRYSHMTSDNSKKVIIVPSKHSLPATWEPPPPFNCLKEHGLHAKNIITSSITTHKQGKTHSLNMMGL